MSDWASRRVCKFILKRVLGRFIKGELDLDRLQIGLGSGTSTIQLNDLALNTHYLNQQLGAATFSVKEGSISSLVIKLPWKQRLDKCQIELDELELVLAPQTEGETSGCTEACSTAEVDSRKSLQSSEHHLKCSRAHDKGLFTYPGIRDGVQMIANQVESLLLGLHVKIKNLVIAFEPCTKNCGMKVGFESSSQSQTILVLRVSELEYGAVGSGDSCDNTHGYPDDATDLAMLSRLIRFHGAKVDLYDVSDNDGERDKLKHTASILTGKVAASEPCDNSVPFIHGDEGGFAGSVELSIPWKSGSIDIPRVDAEIYFDPVKLRLELGTIERLIFLLHSLWGDRGTGSEPAIDSKHRKPLGQMICLGHDEDGCYGFQRESVINEGTFSSQTESFSNIPASATGESENFTLISDSMFISNWMQSDDLEDSVDEFFECFDGTRSCQESHANGSLLGLTYSVFSALTAASTLCTGSTLPNSRDQQVEFNIKARLGGFCVIFVFEDLDHSHLVDSNCSSTVKHKTIKGLDNSRVSPVPNNAAGLSSFVQNSQVECLWQDPRSWDTGNAFLEANFQDLSFNIQVSSEEVRFKSGMKCIEIFEYILDDSEKVTSSSLSNCKEHAQGNRSSISCLQSAVEDVLPSFPLSLHIPDAVNDIAKMKTEESVCSPSKKFVKVQLFVSDSDSDHQFSLVYQFAAPNSTDSKSSTNFDVQLQPFILWVDFYMAKRIWLLMQVIENLRSLLNTNSNEKTDCHSSAGSNDVPKGNIDGTVFVSSSRFILCFPKEGSNNTCPGMAKDLLCFDLSDCGNANKCHCERLLKNERILNNCCLLFSSSVNLCVGECNVFLVSPTLKNDVAWSHGYVDGHPLHAREVFRICNQDENDFSNIGVHWQDAPAMQPRIAEATLKLVKKHWERGSESTEAIGNKLEFIRATTAGTVEDSGSHLREQMRQSSDLCIFFSLPYVQLDLYSSDHILIFNLVHDLMDYMFLEGNARTAFHSEADYDKGTLSLTNKGFDSKESQLTFVFECNVVDIVVHLEESLETKASMKSELPGLWTDISLRVHKFAIMSVSNLGGISGASYFWLTHDEGLLHGTLNERMEKSSESDQKFCLLCCKTDVLGRGDGEGSNALATGNAGTTVIHVSHPQQFQSLTTIMIRCSTLVAPGGRLDWLAAVISFFNQSSNDDHQIVETSGREGLSEGGGPNGSSFATSILLELMDVAVSYEPFPRVPTLSNSSTGVTPYPCTLVNPSEETCSPVACILAAASVRLSIQRKPSSVNKVYTILFQDVGLLVLDLLKQRNKKQAYDAKSLRSRGYVKIGEEASMEVVVKMNCEDGLPWEVTCKEYHILLKTCHDTTEALMRLVGQLQQLFAPDFEESFVHLQTRSTNGKVSSFKVNSDIFEDTSQVYRSNTLNSAMEDVDPCHSCEAALAGLMDGILEDAFSPGADFKAVVENGAFLGSKCKGKPHFFLSGPMLEEGCSKDGTSSTSILNVDSGVLDALSFEPKSGIQVGNMHVSCPEKNNFSLIEDYYYPEYCTGSQRCQGKQIKFGQLVSPGKTVSTVTTDFADLQAGWYDDSTVRVFENHISEVNCQNSGQQDKEDNLPNDMGTTISACKNSQSAGQIVLKNFSIKWRMIAGSDWPALTKCVSLPVNGESSRNESSCLELELHGVNFHYDMFPDGGLYASKLAISIRDLLILDQSINAPWKKVLLDYHSKLHPRESSAKALQLTLEAVKPDPATPLEEYRFLVKLHPLRLHLDQSQLEFMINFFSQSASSSPLQGDPSSHASCSRSVGVNDNNWKNMCSTKDALLPFFQKCEIRSLTIHVDYVPRRVNIGALQGGNYAELLNLISWKDIDLHLKHIQTAGVYGWAHLSDIVIDEWLEDITQNQVHKLFRGAAPIRALYAVCSGAAKLVSIPAEHYKKDRRFLKGVRKGLKAFLRSVSLEALSCGVHLASGAHGILIHTESALDSIPPSFSRTSIENSEASGKCNQPADVRQGLAQACERLTHGFERTTTSLISNPIKSYNRGDGAGTAIATAFRATPAAVVAPVSAAAGAVHRVLLGVRNGLDPEKKKESEEKYSAPLPTLILLD